MIITQERLKEVLDYDPETGVFRWIKKTCDRTIVGSIAGSLNKDGYRQINVFKKKYYAHRLAFLWMNGYFPEKQVDHKNTNYDDNWWDNLREASNQQNSLNCSNRRSCRKSKYKGLWFWEKRNKWQVKIKCAEKKETVGYFFSEEDAARAYDKAAIRLHGKFANLNFPLGEI